MSQEAENSKRSDQSLANPNRVNWEMIHAYANSSDKSTRRAGEQFIYDNAMEEDS